MDYKNTVCICSHWYEEHDLVGTEDSYCQGCDAGGNWECMEFVYDPEGNTPEALAWRK